MIKTAVLVDGGFFHKRYRALCPGDKSPAEVANDLYRTLLQSVTTINEGQPWRLYRMFFYDCPPLDKKAHNPVSMRAINFLRTDEAMFRLLFHEELKRMRKVAIRLGRMADGRWLIKSEKVKDLLSGKIKISELAPSDVYYDARQKGVDMRIGLDIAALAYKKSVDQIVLVSGDSDFVPAAKLARREGIDFVLDPMWNNINADLLEHVDGLSSGWKNSGKDEH